MAKKNSKTVRILRTLPVEGQMYVANNLVEFSKTQLGKLPEDAYDDAAAAVKYCKSEGVDVIVHASSSEGAPAADAPDEEQDGDSGELAE